MSQDSDEGPDTKKFIKIRKRSGQILLLESRRLAAVVGQMTVSVAFSVDGTSRG